MTHPQDSQAIIAWSDPARLEIDGSSLHPMTVFEAMYRAVFAGDEHEPRIACPAGRFDLTADDILAISGRVRPSQAKPHHGCEANALLLDGRIDGPAIEPIYAGNWVRACRRIWSLPSGKRRHGFVVSHDTIYDPGWLEENRPIGVRAALRRSLPW